MSEAPGPFCDDYVIKISEGTAKETASDAIFALFPNTDLIKKCKGKCLGGSRAVLPR